MAVRPFILTEGVTTNFYISFVLYFMYRIVFSKYKSCTMRMPLYKVEKLSHFIQRKLTPEREAEEVDMLSAFGGLFKKQKKDDPNIIKFLRGEECIAFCDKKKP
jgi:hypothetical protein